jgi:hypothetical protein
MVPACFAADPNTELGVYSGSFDPAAKEEEFINWVVARKNLKGEERKSFNEKAKSLLFVDCFGGEVSQSLK